MFLSRLLLTFVSCVCPSHHIMMMEAKTISETLDFLSEFMRVVTYPFNLRKSFTSYMMLVYCVSECWRRMAASAFYLPMMWSACTAVPPLFTAICLQDSGSQFLLAKWQVWSPYKWHEAIIRVSHCGVRERMFRHNKDVGPTQFRSQKSEVLSCLGCLPLPPKGYIDSSVIPGKPKFP
jgi:hypothetical protein